jgi:hypothetical protein
VGSNPGGGLGSNPGLGTFFDQKNRTRKVDQPSAGVGWGDVPTSFASSSSSIGPNLELFTFFAPRPPQDPQATLRSRISLISLCISLQKPYKPIGLGSNPRFWGRGSWVRVPGGRKSRTAQMGSGPLGSPPDCVCPPKSGLHHHDPTGFRTGPPVGPGSAFGPW